MYRFTKPNLYFCESKSFFFFFGRTLFGWLEAPQPATRSQIAAERPEGQTAAAWPAVQSLLSRISCLKAIVVSLELSTVQSLKSIVQIFLLCTVYCLESEVSCLEAIVQSPEPRVQCLKSFVQSLLSRFFCLQPIVQSLEYRVYCLESAVQSLGSTVQSGLSRV